jgi:hypothetical protein
MSESDDLQAFIREIMARSDRGFRDMRARSEEIAREAAEERRRYFEALEAKTEEMIAEGRAGRQALFTLLDRLDGNGGAAASG